MTYYSDDYNCVYCNDEKGNYLVFHYGLKKYISSEGFHLDPESWVEVSEEEANALINKTLADQAD